MANKSVIWDDVVILGRSFRNFDGAPKPWTPRGQKGPIQFAIALTEDRVDELASEGVEVLYTKPWPDAPADWEPTPFVNIHMRFDNFPPKVWMVTETRKVELTEETLGLLNYAEIVSADLKFNISHYKAPTGEGVKLYAQTLYVVIDEDPLDAKYAHIPVSVG